MEALIFWLVIGAGFFFVVIKGALDKEKQRDESNRELEEAQRLVRRAMEETARYEIRRCEEHAEQEARWAKGEI